MTEQDKIRQAIQETPLLSPHASKLLQIVVDPDHELADVVQVVKHDSILTARLLRIVNSPVFGLLNPVSSVDRAVAYLGERMVVSVAMADSVNKLLNKPLEGYEGSKGALWRHDLFTAFAAREIAGISPGKFDADVAFTAGLLHDIGKSIISDFLQGSSKSAVEGIEKGDIPNYLAAEKELLGLDHTIVGYELAMNWNLPEPLPQLILHHHFPQEIDTDLQPLTYAVHLGDVLAMMGGYGTGSDAMQYQLASGYTEFFDFSSDSLATVMLAAQDEYLKAEASMAA